MPGAGATLVTEATPPDMSKTEVFAKAMIDMFGENAETVALAQIAGVPDNDELVATWEAIHLAIEAAR